MILKFVSRQNNILLVKLNSKNMRDYDFLKVTKMLYKLLNLNVHTLYGSNYKTTLIFWKN